MKQRQRKKNFKNWMIRRDAFREWTASLKGLNLSNLLNERFSFSHIEEQIMDKDAYLLNMPPVDNLNQRTIAFPIMQMESNTDE